MANFIPLQMVRVRVIISLQKIKQWLHFPQESTSFWVSTSFKEEHLNAIFLLFYCMFCLIFSGFPLFFVYFVPLVMEKVALASESLFRPANSMRSTHFLVEIHNIHLMLLNLNQHYVLRDIKYVIKISPKLNKRVKTVSLCQS